MPITPGALSPVHRKLLQFVYDGFRETGQWPKSRVVRKEIRRDGDLFDLAQEIGPDLIVAGSKGSPDATCQLRIQALPLLEHAERDIEHVASAILYLVGRYLEADAEARVSAAEVQKALSLSDVETQRTMMWLAYAPRLLGGFGSGPDGQITDFTLSDDILRLEGVTTLEAYLQRTEKLDEDWRRAAAEVSTPPSALSPRPPRLGLRQSSTTLGLHLLELHADIRQHVEKLFADEHYADAVRKALTVFEVRVREMVASRLRPGEEAPYGVDLMGKAFSPKDLIIRLNDGTTPTKRDEQRGFQFLAQGAMAWLRNSLTHELANLQASEALERLGFVSMLMKRLDAAEANKER
ncbi:MAG: TIGR02391 family protein [Gemmatimonadetes bacterium]|nr:TIGR02391 family protein [Gemmatimonadota bacterium]